MRSIKFLVHAFCILISIQGFTDPIQDGVILDYEAGWAKSSATPCPIICKKSFYLPAENESLFYAPTKTQVTYSCKVQVRGMSFHRKLYRGWLYGNNFQGRYQNYCVYPTPDLKQVKMEKQFWCLCDQKL